MKLQSLKCPNCDAALEIEDGIDTFFCKYCGYKIVLAGMSDASYNAKVQVKAMEHQEKMQDKKYEQERFKLNQKEQSKKNDAKRGIIIGAVITVTCVLFFGGVFLSAKSNSDKEEEKLQAIVEEVMIDIENEDYGEAKIKANTIYYTADWSSDIEKKWDDTRKSLLEQIEEAEKEENGGGGFFDWFD